MSLYLKQIEQLVALQHVDHEMHGIRTALKNAPKEVEDIRKRFKDMDAQRARLVEKVEYLKEQEKRLGFEIDDDSSRIKKSKNKLMQVGNTREYHAMMREMDNMERSNRSREEEKTALLEELQRQTEALEALDVHYTALKAELEEKEGTLSARVAEAEKSLEALNGQRGSACAAVPAPVLSRYEFIRQRLENPVIVPVIEQGICTGCHVSIPPQSYIELQKGQQILSCPNCQRLIYWSRHFSEVTMEEAGEEKE